MVCNMIENSISQGWFLVESDDEGGAIEEVILEEKDSYE